MPNRKEYRGCEKERELYERAIRIFKPYRDAMQAEEEFLSGDRYEKDHGPYNKDRRLTQIRGQETQDTVRHIVAQSTARPRSVTAKPRDREMDPDVAEMAASLVEMELSDPFKGFEDEYETAIQACREKRFGAVMVDWDPDCGPFGEILYRYASGDKLMWDASHDPHHPKCGWLLEERREEVDWIKDNFDADWIQPDRLAVNQHGQLNSNIPLIKGVTDGYLPRMAQLGDDKATLWFWWYKNDKTSKRKQKPETFEPLPPEARYMVCKNGCGYRSPRQAEVGYEMPEEMPGCPVCEAAGQVGTLQRIDATQEAEDVLSYTKGRRLKVIAPFGAAPDDKPLADGSWPVPKARSFPGLFLTAYIKPGAIMGPSDTSLMWDQQVAADNLRTQALQRVFEHRNYWVLPGTGIKDWRGQPFAFRDDQFNVMYRDNSTAFGNLEVQQINGTGLDPAFAQVYDLINASLTQYRGVTDLGLTQESSKNIAASTVAQLNQMGEVPTEHFNRRKNRALSKFYGVVWDYIRATYTPARLARLNLDGIEVLANLEGDDLPNMDFVIEETPPFTGLEKARAEAAQSLIQFAQTMPDYLDIYADVLNLPKSVVTKIEKRTEEVMQRQQEAEAMVDEEAGPLMDDPLAEFMPSTNGIDQEMEPAPIG